jgi:polysaccharide biosynthesis protein PslG
MTRRRLAGVLVGSAVLAVAIVLLVSGSRGPHQRAAPPPSTTTRPPPPVQVPAGEQYGVNVNRLFDDRTYSAGEIDAQLAALHDTGAAIARSDTLWEAVEPTPPAGALHHYDWSFDDLVAGSLARHSLQWLALVDYSAGWARAQPSLLHSPPVKPGRFAAFAAAFAARYGRGGAFWAAHPELPDIPVQTYEIWNEPDNGEFWQPVPNAAAYSDLYLAARTAITRVDPTARVIVGGLTKPTTFLPQMLDARAQLRGALDGVAVHPYARTPEAVLGRIRHDRQALNALGLGSVPLYVTEFGWSTRPVGALGFAPESRRPDYITSTIAALGHTNCSIAAVTLYTWVTPERNPADHEDWFGINPPRGGSSSDRQAFAAGVAHAREHGTTLPVCGPA